MEENRLRRCLKCLKVNEGWIHGLRAGVDLSECDRVHLPVGHPGCHEKKKWKEKKLKTIFGRKGRERRLADDIRRVCHDKQHSVPDTGPSNKTPQEMSHDGMQRMCVCG